MDEDLGYTIVTTNGKKRQRERERGDWRGERKEGIGSLFKKKKKIGMIYTF